MFNFNKKSFKKFDYTLLVTTIILCIFGLVVLYSATLSFNTFSYMKSQIASTLLGFLAILILILMDYQFLGKLYIPIYIVSNLILIAVLVWGIGDRPPYDWGSRSWLNIAGVTFQPSEFVKIGLLISLAKFIDLNKEDLNEPFTLLKVLAFAFFPVFLILKQPDAGTAMVFIFFIAAMLFIAGISWKYIGYALGLGILSLPVLWMRLDLYQKNRILDFLDPDRDALGTGMQFFQGRIAIGSGKFFGKGLFQGVQTQFNFVPIKESDFIFAVIGEELGFLGGAFLILLYLILILRLLNIAKNSNDLFGSLMVVGIAAIFLFHVFENIGMTIGVMPITGIPLPFISHGGTFQLVSLVSIGIALSVSLNRDELTF